MADGSGKVVQREKWIMLLMIWLMMIVAYLDRINIAVAGPTMMRELHMTPMAFGSVLSAFTFGYALIQIPGGYLADKFGAKRLLVVALIWWSLFTGLTGVAASLGLLIAIRVLFGVGEGLENGAQFKLIADFFPSEERSAANGIFLTSLALGPAFVAPIAAWIIRVVGWRELFFIFVIPGLVMAILLYKLIPEKPTGGVVHTVILNKSGGQARWKDVISYPSLWLSFFTYLFFNIAFWGFLLWMPSYLSMSRHVKLADLGFYGSLPYVLGFFGLLFLGWCGTKLFYAHRASLIAVSYILAAVALYFAYTAATINTSVLFLSIAGFFLYGGFGPFWAVSMDLIPDDLRATLSGFVNMGGQIGGFIAPLAVGAIVSATGSFAGGFVFMIAGLLLAAVALFMLQILSHATHASSETAAVSQ